MSDEGVPVAGDHTHVVPVGRIELSLEEFAILHPGVAALMLDVSQRFTRGYHAAQAKNAMVARFQISEGIKILRKCAVVQPRYEEAIAEFLRKHAEPIRDRMAASKWDEIGPLWQAMTEEVNRLHGEFAHGFLVWKVGDQAPDDLDLTP